MPFRDEAHHGSFRPNELELLQQAYNEACVLLDRCPKTHEYRSRMAKSVIRSFETGERDPYVIAEKVAAAEIQIELMDMPAKSKRA